MKLPLITVNAFASQPFSGNPAAVTLLDDWLEDATLQAIAAQNNIAETAFLLKTGPGAYKIRWFTPAVEVPLCGHATLASAFALRERFGENSLRITFESKSGPLAVDCDGNSYTLDFPSQPPQAAPTPNWFLNAFGAHPIEFHQSAFSLALFPSQEIVAALEPDFALLSKTKGSNVIVSAPGEQHDFISRFFAPADGINEDPVTGSAHCILTPYWAKRLGKTTLRARQISPRGGELRCQLAGDRVLISGQAQLYSEATIHI
ncbi:PhzF family phenazine biosynthesis protein [Pelagicoccus sp. SDUM812005]|uniref:PhzF family phenazine biosynthesis protein n=1 Tax=Pelagicoccus sp. SDUM812005 TaxID=3041257 RepID=UPI00280DFC44|nr:PhzF family phenazine biosynthesis protein [Pelagicoccus sp. SDUM812005]MDQ8181769.1 PhzF family phenazine biosynthesis protein [Pelagicoccus sp. SDUM812005]